MTGQPTREQWQWPPNAWQPPPVPSPPPPGAPVAPAPEAPPRRSRKVWAVAAGGTLTLLAAVLVMCGPGSGDDVRVVAVPDASPSTAAPTGLPPVSPSAATPSPSPLPSPAPTIAQLGGTGEPTSQAAAPVVTAAPPEPEPADAQHATAGPRPKPGRTPRPSPSAHAAPPPPGGSIPALGPGGICDQAERVGRWPAGSQQARLCHSIYG
ncbi:hypothetical protein [Kitasatospora sp. NPDC058190]|uniref:hypothetical protein n=1 Tax=Kitasatospora sp. NPDC058190 TaxID=3346371 RepID=UPI0036D8B5E0